MVEHIGCIGDRVSLKLWDNTVRDKFGTGVIIAIASCISESGWMYTIENVKGRVLTLDIGWLTSLESNFDESIFDI